MRENGDPSIRPLELSDLLVQPREVAPVPLVVRGHVPPVDLVEVVEAHADGHFALGRDVGEEAAAEDDGVVGVGEAEDGAVEEDEGAEGGVFGRCGGVLLEGVQDCESVGPAGMVGFVVSEDEHDGLEVA